MRLPCLSDPWLRATAAVAVAHVLFVASVLARPGLPAVVLWLVAPLLLGLAGAALLAVAFLRSWRHRWMPARRQLAGLVALVAVIGSLAAFRTYPSSYDARPSQVRFRLPLDGPVTVVWGGPTRRENYHAALPAQRWAYDLLLTVDGRSFRGDGARLEDYYAFGQPVLAPAAGTSRAVQDGEPDGPIGQWRGWRAAGNYVVLEVAEGEFLFIAHLQNGSIAVAPGDHVEAGQVIGRVGNSGDSSEPHVHVHLQDTPTASLGEGIPMYFHGYRSGEREIVRGMPTGGRGRSADEFIGDVVEHIAG